MAPLDAWWVEETGAAQMQDRDKAIKTIRRALADARAYQAAHQAHAAGISAAPEFDARWEAMIPVLERKIPVFIDAEDIQQIQSALAFTAGENLRAVIVGGYDAPECIELLKKQNVPVIIGGVHRLPRRRTDAYDAPFTVPARLQAAGIPFCIAGVIGGASGSSPANLRNLPYHAGTAAAHGLAPDEALKSVTLSAAKILGVDDRIGSLEPGKDATLIVTTGDPLEIPTQVTAAYIQGRQCRSTTGTSGCGKSTKRNTAGSAFKTHSRITHSRMMTRVIRRRSGARRTLLWRCWPPCRPPWPGCCPKRPRANRSHEIVGSRTHTIRRKRLTGSQWGRPRHVRKDSSTGGILHESALAPGLPGGRNHRASLQCRIR